MAEPVRLAKRLAELVSCSRREAEQYIEGGWVRVAGQVVEEPQFRVLDQKIELDLKASLTPVEPVTILLNKPPGHDAGAGANPAQQLITAATRWADDSTGIQVLRKHFSQLTPTTPLEIDASGLVVFTQDWRVARKLIEDADKMEHEVIVEIAGKMAPDGLKRLNHGLSFNGRVLPPIKVSWQNETRLRFAMKAARIGQIAFMCESVGLEVLAMKRIRIGRVPMARLPPGEWRYLQVDEWF